MALSCAKALMPILVRAQSATILTGMRTMVPRVSGVRRQFHMSSLHSQQPEADRNLLKAVDRELMLVKRELQKLPEVAHFECSVENAVATLRRTVGNEEVTVTLDTNSGVEMDMHGGDLPDSEERIEDGMDSEDTSAKVTAFTVTVSKPSGNKMQFECSFHPGVDDFEEQQIMIDAVSVIPKDCTNVDSIYTVDTNQLEEDLYHGMEQYLTERGITNTFGSDLLNFYGIFEHRAYTTDFLERIKNFCSEK